MMAQEMLDMAMRGGVPVAGALGAGHPECGSIPTAQPEIKLPQWGGARAGAGRPRRVASVAVLAPGQAGPRWYVAQVDRREVPVRGDVPWHAALEHAVEAVGCAAVVPLYRSVAGELVAAFPGYALVEMDLRDARWRQVPRVRGVRRLIGPAEQPTPVVDVQAAWVLAQFGPDGVQRREIEVGAVAPLPIGVQVRVVGGLGLGWAGCVLESDGRSVVLEVEGRRVKVAQGAVVLAGPPQQ